LQRTEFRNSFPKRSFTIVGTKRKAMTRKLEIRFINALKQWRSTKSKRDREIVDLVKSILMDDFKYSEIRINNLIQLSLT
jgi:hypothetical protein